MVLIGLLSPSESFGDEAPLSKAALGRTLDYERDVRPILAKHCFECHGPETEEGGLRLDERQNALKGGKSGRLAIVPEKSAESRVIQVITGRDPKLSMPPDGARLMASEIQTLRRWIDQGANWNGGPPNRRADRTAEPLAKIPGADFWSFQPVHPVKVPLGNRFPQVANLIDAFIFQKVQSAGLQPSREADRRSLIRRLYLDALGLPPTPEEIADFSTDTDPLAWSRLVDRVLASPHYGERWARHWLDVVRFAETDGFETNVERPNAFRYRDYIIRALNDDKPYDRFVFEQLAGDAVGEYAATGFLVAGPCDKVKSPDVVLTRMQRQDELSDIINATGTTFLGLTLGCAKCHNHKFDPIPQRDFFAIQAVFAGVKHGDHALPASVDPERSPRRMILDERIGQTLRELAALGLQPPVDPRSNQEEFPPIRARRVRFTVRATSDGLEPCLDELEVFAKATGDTLQNVALASAGAKPTCSSVFPSSGFHKLEHINDGRYGNERSWISNERGKGWISIVFPREQTICRIVWARDRDGHYQDRLPTDYVIEVADGTGKWTSIADSSRRLPTQRSGTAGVSLSSASFHLENSERISNLLAELHQLRAGRRKLEETESAYSGQFEEPDPVHRLFRGDPMLPREVVPPGGVAVLGRLEIAGTAPEQRRRVALASWIARAQNPLTARVIVNRLWHYHFGRGIVETPSDFGHNGGQPSHPEMLDWLAGELVRSGWSLKHVHRLILTSSTYRQSSAPQADGMRADAGARLLWRFPPRRLEAEAIRDSMLASSGVLDERINGPGFSAFQPNDNYVRVYRPKEQFGPAEWRRMVYMSKVRMEQDGVFGAFDCPDGGLIAPRRTQSTTALQALNLMNSRFTIRQAELLALRTTRETGPHIERQIRRAFELTFGRGPDEVEGPAAERLVETHGLPALCRALFNANEFLFVP